jgi:phosphoribosylglycinamide formyltransferase 1
VVEFELRSPMRFCFYYDLRSTPPKRLMSDSFLPANFTGSIYPELSTKHPKNDRPLRLGVMASGNGTNFAALAQAIAEGKLNAEIPVLVYNNPHAKVAKKADNWQIPSVLIDHREFSSRKALDQKIADTFDAHQVDIVIMAGWMRIITQVLIDAFPNRLINIHPSLLPSFKGMDAVEQALAAKVKLTGCTVHLVTLEVDSGPILIQAAVPVLPNDTSETLHARIQIQEHQILPEAIAILAEQF